MIGHCVVDASALGYALVGRSPEVAKLRRTLAANECHAPHLVDAEVGSLLRKRVRARAMSVADCHVALLAAQQIVHRRYAHVGPLAEHAWRMRDNFSFYDALYVALAARLDIPLITGDGRLSRAPGLPCAVDLVGAAE